MKLLLLLALACVSTHGRVLDLDGDGELWAVLVAGSNMWYNYRHQADVCHAYQILHAHGVPDDHIIVMMTDDIANNKLNPTPGKIINRPNGTDVYHGVPKDYVGAAVTPQNFLQVITGNATGLDKVGSGKVLKSGPNDRVFINLVDHGAPGIFGFPPQPHVPGHPFHLPVLKATDFMAAIKGMHKKNMYKDMVIYLESCESGSMFSKILPKDINVYAVSAANATQPSYACYMDKGRKTFLGDVFSIKWMEDTDREDVTKETLKKQYQTVKKEVTKSEVSEWGTKKISHQDVGMYVGEKNGTLGDSWGPFPPFPPYHDPCLNSSVASPDTPVAILEAQLNDALATNDLDQAQHMKQEITKLNKNRLFISDVMKNLVLEVTGDAQVTAQIINEDPHEISDWPCYEASMENFNNKCFDLANNPHALRHLQTLVNLCEHGYTSGDFVKAAEKVCTFPPVTGII